MLIARVLAQDTPLILADEPTGSLDSQSGQEILDILADLHRRQQTTLILVTHDPLVAERGQRLIRLLDGDILEDAMLSSPSGSAKQPTGRLR